MRLAAHLAVALVACACPSCRSPALAPDISPLAAPTAEPTSVGDVEPLEAEDREWIKSVADVLGDGHDTALWMLTCPSFHPESSVSLRSPPHDAPEGTAWRLEMSRGTDQIASAQRAGKSVAVRRSSADVKPADAVRIVDAWRSVVIRARPKPPVVHVDANGERTEMMTLRLDGTQYRFRCGELAARSQSPDPGLASNLIALGEKLYWVAASPPEYQAELIAECVQIADALRKKAETAPP